MKVRQRAADILSLKLSFAFLQAGPGKLRVLLTPAGAGFFGMVLCGFLLSINFSNNLIFAMTFLLVAIALISCYHTLLNVSSLSVSEWKVEPVFAGQPLLYTAKVQNYGRMSRHGLLARHTKKGKSAEFHLAPESKNELQLVSPPRQRGLVGHERAFLTSRFPLGLFEGRFWTSNLPACIVYPRPSGAQPLPENGFGSHAHRNSEAGTYKDIRRYSPGDPLSRISWRAFARFDELYTKDFDGAQGLPALWLGWDDVTATGEEDKLSQLCRWVVDARRQNREYGLNIPGCRIEPSSDDDHYRRCLHSLAVYNLSEERG